MMLKTRCYPLLLLAVASFLPGCLPASRVSHNGERSRKDAETLHTAHTDKNLTTERRQVLIAAEKWLGVPYVYGGASPKGTDCSGFVRSVFRDIHISLPRTSQEQSGVGNTVSRQSVLAGDLLFFNTTGDGVSHVGIAIGHDQFIHASTSRGVIVSSLDEQYYGAAFLFARRVL